MDDDYIMADNQIEKSKSPDSDPVACGSNTSTITHAGAGQSVGQLDQTPTPAHSFVSPFTTTPPTSFIQPGLSLASVGATSSQRSSEPRQPTMGAKPLGRTQTLGSLGPAPSLGRTSSDIFSGSGNASLFEQHDSSVDDDTLIKSDVDADIDIEVDDWQDGTQPLEEDVAMGEPQSQSQQQQQTGTTLAPPPSLTVSTNPSSAQSQHRFPSPVPTEPEDPDPEFISNQLARHQIKVTDYGMYPPYTAAAPHPPTLSPNTTPNTNGNNPNINISLTPEIFDPYKALGEFEYRLRQNPRTLPIPGKSLRRLLEINWVSVEEVRKRCSTDDIKNLEEFDERNRLRALRLSEKARTRQKDLSVSSGDEDGSGNGWGFGFNPDGSYPYLTLGYTNVPTYAERDELVNSVRPLFVTVDRVVRMAMAMERERERDRLEAEEAMAARRKREEEETKEREREAELERENIQREMNEERDREIREETAREEAKKSLGAWVSSSTTAPNTAGTIKIPPRGDTYGVAPTARKRSPHQAWADDDDAGDHEDEGDWDIEAKRLRLARSQSETWYEQERRLQQEQQAQQSQSQSRPQSQSPRKLPPAHAHTHSRSQSQSQSMNFVPPEKQYPAPLSTYDPHLYPDAASVIESQSQSQSQRGGAYAREGTPLNNPEDPQGQSQREGEGADVEEDTRPNALKRSPKKGLKRGLTRGRTLVQIC
ncbi:hypothetical protein P691DRAFT_776692 [Macrolepiota fuliginosa MF-IS2]|uniref:Uncharacterized protein n=1 Tax=Macrolepiota fuliginosa MF-IS2 TaxID=1400762 RepID=A0A9P5XBR0_9AGAR|nr:hypothetical protein P691DRAFT_776692 [Macrolepiota fuliginosa MF-IS2]